MTVHTLKFGGKRFVVVEQHDFRRLERLAGTADERGLPTLPEPLPDGNYPVQAMRIGFARRLIRDRRAVGSTQVELARRAGIASESLHRIEKGKLTPAMGTLRDLAAGSRRV